MQTVKQWGSPIWVHQLQPSSQWLQRQNKLLKQRYLRKALCMKGYRLRYICLNMEIALLSYKDPVWKKLSEDVFPISSTLIFLAVCYYTARLILLCMHVSCSNWLNCNQILRVYICFNLDGLIIVAITTISDWKNDLCIFFDNVLLK